MAFQIDLQDAAMFEREILEIQGTLQVLEVYNEWCGPCKAINSTLKRMYFDHGDRGLKFFTVEASKLELTKAYVGKCEPVFMFFCNGQELKDMKLVGVDAPKLTASILAKLDTLANEA